MPLGIATRAIRSGIGAVRHGLRSGAGRLRLRPLQLVVILILVIGGLAAALSVAADERAGDRAGQQAWAGRAATSLDRSVTSAGAVLTSTRGLFAAMRPAVDADAFARFAAVELHDSQILSLTWAPRVPSAGREGYRRATGREILEPGPTGAVRPAGDRAEYFPLTLIAPDAFATNAWLGIDVARDPALGPSLAAARDTGEPVMTKALSLGLVGFLAAVYGPDPAPGTVAERRAGLRGFTGGIFTIDALAESTFSILPPGSRLEIVSAGVRVFDSGEGALPDGSGEAQVGETPWSVHVVVEQGDSLTSLPVLAFAGGSLALALLVAILFAQANQRRHDRERAQARLRTEADTDGLTGLANRRRLERDLAAAVAVASTTEPLALMLLDLNGFKGYNDGFGHPAGDALLVRLSARLREAVPEGRVYRLGGDEFCVLAPVGPAALMEIVPAAAAALTERGEGFMISAAHGVALVPEDSASVEGAMLVADQRMYARKALGRQSAGNQSADVLLRAIAERSHDLGDHTRGVADLVDCVAGRLGLDDTERSPVRRAALLHDVGKVAIPDSILDKPAPLDATELAFIRRHTIIGERILRAAPSLEPIASMVRSSHERWDGTGYPDGLSGEEIPLGARIVFACDAFEAMTSSRRAYRAPLSLEAAIDELTVCAGSQFDPRVVAVLVAVVRDKARAVRAAATTGASLEGKLR